MKSVIAERIRLLMQRRGIASEPELAKLAGVTQSTVWRLLNDATDPSLSTLRKISRVLRVKVGQLIGEEPIDEDKDDDIAAVLVAMQTMPSYKRGAMRTAAERLSEDC